MRPKIIKQTSFEDGLYTIKAPPFVPPGMLPAFEDEGASGVTHPLDPAIVAALKAAAEEEAGSIIEQAREAASDMVRRAMDEAGVIRAAAAEEGHREGHAEGMEKGRLEGGAAVGAAHANSLRALASAIEFLDQQRAEREAELSQELAKLAVAIASKVLAVELGHGREAATVLAREALSRITDKTQIRLRVHPLDMPAIVAAKQDLMLSVDGLTQLDVVADQQVGLGGCQVETRAGLVDARLSTQLSEVAMTLLDVEPGVEAVEGLDPMVVAAVRALSQRGNNEPSESASAIALRKRREAEEAAAKAKQEAEAMLAAARNEAARLVEQARSEAEHEAEPEQRAPHLAIGPLAEVTMELGFEAQDADGLLLEADLADAEDELATDAPLDTPEDEAGRPAETATTGVDGLVAPGTSTNPIFDPSKRAARALAARLGQMKLGRAVLSLQEELAAKQLMRGEQDIELEAVVRQTQLSQTEIGLDEQLVISKFHEEQAANRLAARLGQKNKRTVQAAPEGALEDNTIDAIIDGVGLKATGSDELVQPQDVLEESVPSLDKASEKLSLMLGKKPKRSNKAWYE